MINLQLIQSGLSQSFTPFNTGVNIIKSAMFSFKEKQNSDDSQMTSAYKLTQQNYSRQRSREEKEKKISNLRQVYVSSAINWQQPINSFLETLQTNPNQYSLLLTLFEISQYPLWRNRIPHICSLIQLLHNHCADKQGDYLSQLTHIPNYHQRLCRIFYLNDNQVQQHFKLIITIYLSYNIKLNILDETQIALGLVHAGRHRGDNKIGEYLWIVCQIKVDNRTIAKVIKYGQEMLVLGRQNKQSEQVINQTLIPLVTILSNYLYCENDVNVLDQLIQNQSFQGIFMHSLSQSTNPDLSREALLLCNNLLAKSQGLASKIMSSRAVMSAASRLACPQHQIFMKLTQMRNGSVQS